MQLIKKYWWVIAAAVLYMLMGKKKKTRKRRRRLVPMTRMSRARVRLANMRSLRGSYPGYRTYANLPRRRRASRMRRR